MSLLNQKREADGITCGFYPPDSKVIGGRGIGENTLYHLGRFVGCLNPADQIVVEKIFRFIRML